MLPKIGGLFSGWDTETDLIKFYWMELNKYFQQILKLIKQVECNQITFLIDHTLEIIFMLSQICIYTFQVSHSAVNDYYIPTHKWPF